MFRPGDLFEYSFSTTGGEVGLLAEVQILADTLWLRDIAVYPVRGNKLLIGSTEVKRCLSQLEDMARSNGFRRLRISGKRFSGATKGRQVDLTRVL